jgi:RNA polymerase sigma factor (sigma-70 family)
MAIKTSGPLLKFIRGVTIDELMRDASDHELLCRFVDQREEEAFQAILRRHGPMVFGVCRGLLTNEADAEDAFQATFLVLASKADSLRRMESLTSWLHGIAYRIALKARAAGTRRKERESRTVRKEAADPDQVSLAEIRIILHEELAGLPKQYRLPLSLCYLQGKTQDETAVLVGLSKGTLKRRLEKGRALLRERLIRRGLGSVGLLLAAAWPGASLSARIPPLLLKSVVQAAGEIAAGSTPTVSPVIATLTQGVSKMMVSKTIKCVAGLMVCGLLALAWLAGGVPPFPSPAPAAIAAQDNPKAAIKAVDPKPLPKGPNLLLIGRRYKEPGAWTHHLDLIDPNGKNERLLLTLNKLDYSLLSPDGKRMAYLADQEGKPGVDSSALYVAGVDDKEGQSLGFVPHSFAWSPDSAEIACTEYPDRNTEKPTKLTAVHWIINVKTKEKTKLKLPEDHRITDWSRDGKYFLTSHTWPNAGIFLMNRDGTEHKSLTAKQLPAGSKGLNGRLSPDGKRVLFNIVTPPKQLNPEKPEESKIELAVLDIASGNVTPVSGIPINRDVGMGWSFCWSPDGKQIAYLWQEAYPEAKANDLADPEVESQLVVCDPDGKNAKSILTEKRSRVHPIISVDWR